MTGNPRFFDTLTGRNCFVWIWYSMFSLFFRRQRSLQYFTSIRSFPHFFRQVNGRLHTGQIFVAGLVFHVHTFKEEIPPSGRNTCPDMKTESSLNSQLPVKLCFRIPDLFQGMPEASFTVGIQQPFSQWCICRDGATTFTRMEGAHSAARDLARPSTAPFAPAMEA